MMGSCLSKKIRIKIIDKIKERPKFDYLRPKWEIVLSIDQRYNVPAFYINFDVWYTNSVRLWPKNNKLQHCVS